MRGLRLAAGSGVRLTVALLAMFAIVGGLFYGLVVLLVMMFGCFVCAQEPGWDDGPTAPTNDAYYSGEVIEVWQDPDGWDDRVTLRVASMRAWAEPVPAPSDDNTLVVRTQTNGPKWFAEGDQMAVFAHEWNGWVTATYIHDLSTDAPFLRSNGSGNYVAHGLDDVGTFTQILDCLVDEHGSSNADHPRLEALITNVAEGGFDECRDSLPS